MTIISATRVTVFVTLARNVLGSSLAENVTPTATAPLDHATVEPEADVLEPVALKSRSVAAVTLILSVSPTGVCATSVAHLAPVQWLTMVNARPTVTAWVISVTALPRPVVADVSPEWPTVRNVVAAMATVALVDVSVAHAVLREVVWFQKMVTARITLNVLPTGVLVGMEIFVVCAYPRLPRVTYAAVMTNVILVNVTVEHAARI